MKINMKNDIKLLLEAIKGSVELKDKVLVAYILVTSEGVCFGIQWVKTKSVVLFIARDQRSYYELLRILELFVSDCITHGIVVATISPKGLFTEYLVELLSGKNNSFDEVKKQLCTLTKKLQSSSETPLTYNYKKFELKRLPVLNLLDILHEGCESYKLLKQRLSIRITGCRK